ncbi:FAD/NAD(P)-binding domain-containing protein [Westerdykella ornata]|uniref:FAD/NAD(P)-binding domain-containing protein n=1 Tax=Westerdykella ornata TaxID=318751 RepID=A0A6A6JEX7_WESOR|nr:FAD/NAD(P)-binding domain-containing protein [Westerdykella ornata]KAF2274186.1 FAD/NAD(P)-binding domain-containing protein [Westerdykella ornata]
MYPKSAVIVGGSVAGLLQGLQLKRKGTNVIVLEQDPNKNRHTHESGVTIGPSVVGLLRKYDATGLPPSIFTEYMSLAWRKRLRVPPGPKEGDGAVEYRQGKRAVGVSYNREKGIVTVKYVDVITGEEDSVSAESVIVADGVHTSIAKMLQIPIRKDYAGYIAWRGTVPESRLSRETIEYFSNRLNFTLLKGTYFISYFIPTETGRIEPGKRLLNWVWYFVVPEGSPELTEIFTDVNGKFHPSTVPHGLIKPNIWAAQIARYKDQMIAPLAEAVTQTPLPFVTKVAESEIQQASHFDNRLVVVGDAFTALRSHMGMASEQAARHCWQMDRV